MSALPRATSDKAMKAYLDVTGAYMAFEKIRPSRCRSMQSMQRGLN